MIRLTRLRLALPRTFTLLTTAWHEAQAADAQRITLDHLLLSLLAAGGPASELLARHGATLPSLRAAIRGREVDDLATLGITPPAPRPRRSLRETVAAPRELVLDPEVERLLNALPLRWGEQEMLRQLLEHPSGGPAVALDKAGVDVAALRQEAAGPGAFATGHERTAPVPGLLDGQPESTTVVERFLPVAYPLACRVVREPALMAQWGPYGPEAEASGEVVLPPAAQQERARAKGFTQALHRVVDESTPDRTTVAWQERWTGDDKEQHGFYLHLVLTPAPGGTRLRLTRGAPGFGRLGGLFRRLSALLTPLSTGHLVHGIATVAEGLDESDPQPA
ncbi:Clp protease N-terminal domain-containing protein [Luteococcus peritonei]|uniref:Clp protease N-terminal domain-containing protein n=1 Tax=Luteococcus peritonei TaxID=88874 RepID=A0ABW4RY27_9ACTN